MNRFTLRAKLIGAFLIMAVLPLLVGVFTNIQISNLSEDAAVDQNLNRIQIELLNSRRHEKNYFLRKDQQYVDKVKAQVATMLAIAEKDIAPDDLTVPQQALMKEAIAQTHAYLAAFLKQVEASKVAGDSEADINDKEKDVIDAARKIEANITKISTDIHQGTINSYRQIKWLNIVLATIAVVIAIVFGLCISIRLTRKIAVVSDSLEAASNQTSEASHEVASSSQELAHGASEQASSLQETSASMEEISSTINANTGNAREVKGLTTETHAITQKQTEGMRTLQTHLSNLSGSAREMTEAIDGIKSSSDSISQIIKTIDEIAFQTNILALNAAVEAARAGDAGAGFAVVADEVRNLAKRSADAAKETSALIENAITKSNAGVRVNETISKVIDQVERNATEVQKGLESISTKVAQVDTAMTQIVTASEEQSRGVEQINTALSQMDKVTQSNAGCAEESASAAEELSAQAEELKALAVRLEEIVQGEGNRPHVAPLPASTSVKTHSPKTKTVSRSATPSLSKGGPVRSTSVPTPDAAKTSGDIDMDFKDL